MTKITEQIPSICWEIILFINTSKQTLTFINCPFHLHSQSSILDYWFQMVSNIANSIVIFTLSEIIIILILCWIYSIFQKNQGICQFLMLCMSYCLSLYHSLHTIQHRIWRKDLKWIGYDILTESKWISCFRFVNNFRSTSFRMIWSSTRWSPVTICITIWIILST